METTVRELKAHLSEYLRRAVAGEDVVVTLRGKPVVRLAPVTAVKVPEELEKEALARLDAAPWISLGNGGKVRGLDCPIAWPLDEKPLSQLVMEDRE